MKTGSRKMKSEYKIGAVAGVISTPSGSKKKKKNAESSLFDNVTSNQSPIFTPFVMPKDSKSPEKKKNKEKLKDNENIGSHSDQNMNDNANEKEEQDQSKRFGRTPEVLQRRKERKLLKKERKQKSREAREKFADLNPEASNEAQLHPDENEMEEDVVKKQGFLPKRGKGEKRTPEEIQKRKEKKIRKKEAKQKLQEKNKAMRLPNGKIETGENDEKGQSLLFKREKGLKTADDEAQRRRDKKFREKGIKRKHLEEDDEDEERAANKKMKFPLKSAKEASEADDRTVFVGNLPITMKRPDLKKYFSQIGPVESVRLRSAPVSKPEISKRVAVLRQDFHPERTSINGYVVFTTKELAEKSLTLNASIIDGHHIRVDMAFNKPEPDHKHSVFVGNLPFSVEVDELWTVFNDCGEITDVRVIRDKETGVGRGFGYVTFKETDSVELALKLATHEISGRKIRVSRSMNRRKKEEKGRNRFAIAKQSKKKNKGKSFGGDGGSKQKKFQGVSSKRGLKLSLAKKGKVNKKLVSEKKSKSKSKKS